METKRLKPPTSISQGHLVQSPVLTHQQRHFQWLNGTRVLTIFRHPIRIVLAEARMMFQGPRKGCNK